MKLTGKITRVERKSGFYSLRFSIVHYKRDERGRPFHKIIAAFPTVRSDTTDRFDVQKGFWDRVDAETARLIASGIAMDHDVWEIERKFSVIIPRPTIAGLEFLVADNILLKMQSKYPVLKKDG